MHAIAYILDSLYPLGGRHEQTVFGSHGSRYSHEQPIGGAVFLNPQAVQGQEATGWLALDSELQRMEPYVRVRSSGDFPVQTLDADAALTNGFSREALSLAQEMIDLQNDMSRLLFRQGGADITQLDIDLRGLSQGQGVSG